MNKKLQFTLLLSLVVLLTSFSGKAQSNFGQLKAAFKADTGRTYFFTKDKYYRYNIDSDYLENKGGQPLANWKGLPLNFDAALYNPKNGYYYFFKGDKYDKYDFKKGTIGRPYKLGVEGWRGVPANIDAAVVSPTDKNVVYFFKGDKYYRYSHQSGKVNKTALLTNWKGLPSRDLDAVLLHKNGKLYFFKGNKYYKYNFPSIGTEKVGTIGKDGWRGLSFSKEPIKTTPSSEKNLRLKVTLTRIKSVKARDSDDIADFALWQWINYKANSVEKEVLKRNIKVLSKDNINYKKPPIKTKNTIINSGSIKNYSQIHVREGNENNYINNSIVFEISPQEAKDRRSKFEIGTILMEISGTSLLEDVVSFANIYPDVLVGWNGIRINGDSKEISHNNNSINVNIYEVLDYLQNPKASKYSGKKYFNGGHNGKIHESGAFGDVMWLERASNNALKSTLEFGDNNAESYVRFYYRFELVP